jgi:rod shape-determining protein MreC|uniref:Cell shape-determining protein MreC n=1 Tax=candidate division WOR-3 bacterium TaxID=2052148 RepID=A0A7C6A8U3_UNCW3
MKPPDSTDLAGSRLFFIFLLISVVLLFISGSIKLRLLAYPKAVFLAPLNISLRFFNNISTLRQENSRLKGLLARLQIENATLKEIIQRQGGELNLSEFRLEKAQIVGRDQMTFGSYLLLDKGAAQGLKVNMPVITEQGIVGKVIQVSTLQALVETMRAKDSKIAGMDQRSRVTGVVSVNRGNRLKLNYVTSDADIQIGDTIISSGLGGVFPKGLLIGQVIKTQDHSQANGLFKEILLKPFVDIYQIEEVYIITGAAVKSEPPKPERVKTDWEKTKERLRIEPPLEIKIR